MKVFTIQICRKDQWVSYETPPMTYHHEKDAAFCFSFIHPRLKKFCRIAQIDRITIV